MSYDPRVIAVALEDLLEEMRLWSSRASQTLAAASYIQRQARETAERALHKASVLLDEARRDEQHVLEISGAADALMIECRTARAEALSTLEQAEAELDDANSTLEFWEEELRKALAWLARAEARLERALHELRLAQTAYTNAQWELDRAQSRYRDCLNNKNRSNCDSESRALRAAQEEMQVAAHNLQLAREEVMRAEAEVAAARARVRCCTNAVKYATEAAQLASEAESEARQAVNSAERSLEFAHAASVSMLVAKEKVSEEVLAAEQMVAVVRDAVAATDEAALHLATADNAEESAQRYARGAEHELEYRLQLLYQLNRPDLHAGVSGRVAKGAAGMSMNPAAGQAAQWVDAGIRFVNVADLPDPEGISGQADFRKATEPEMRSGLRKLQEMRPVIESGAGNSSDYWADYDRRHGLEFADGYQRVYEAFYGMDCIKVNKDQNSYDIDNGRHRIWLAKQMGIEQLPIRIVERRGHGR